MTTPFLDFLNHRLDIGGFTTEDTLASFLPLARQVAAAHAAGKTAPLVGIEHLAVEGVRIFFDEALVAPPILDPRRLRDFDRPAPRAIDVVGQYRIDTEAETGLDQTTNIRVGKRGEPLTVPVYLPGYVSWEHEIPHHDPLGDIFVCGLVLASLACGLSLSDPDDLNSFVAARGRLFDLNPNLHPVLAKLIVRMTELDRHKRPQDMAGIVGILESYRDQGIDLDIELARAPELKSSDPMTRTAAILTCLRRRLFDVSRRNRLLHFRPTNQSVNLTWASVPLAFDIHAIRPEQILTANLPLQKALASGTPLSLNKYLRFEEAIYLPGQLDAIRNDARRDQSEFGFAQLRLVLCFLRWANLKTKPAERFDSPLVLLPVRLEKTKGVRDVFTLELQSTEAEVNPVLRHQLQQLYGIDLPAMIDLDSSSLEELFGSLQATIQMSEPAVTVEKIDKPRIHLIHAQAQRRLDQFRRRARLSGRGVRSYGNLDYSYNRENFHPLGLRLFQTRLMPSDTNLRSIIDETPRPRANMAPASSPASQRQLYSKVEEQANPFVWEFDLCSVTLGNFHYRKMSLVRDYETFINSKETNVGVEALFSSNPRPAAATGALKLDDSYPIVSCDAAQASAIGLARTGQPFIIQGPPGTGKSQTITNLIADYVARGLTVLFVCEKRAAIDVVFQRLRLAGLDRLCCLIHDSQEDKKSFIQDLKQTYEAFLEPPDKQRTPDEKRASLLREMTRELEPLEHLHRFMTSAPQRAGVSVRQVLERAIRTRACAPRCTPLERERLPDFAQWHANAGPIDRVRSHLENENEPLARHPLRSLHARFAMVDLPLESIRRILGDLEVLFGQIEQVLDALQIPADCRSRLVEVRSLAEYGRSLSFLADEDRLQLLRPKSEAAKAFAKFRKDFEARSRELAQAEKEASGWRTKLSLSEAREALAQAETLEGRLLRFFNPRWWRLRSILNRQYNFAAHSVKPRWTHVLKILIAEHEARARLDELETKAKANYGAVNGTHAFVQQLTDATDRLSSWPAPVQAFHRQLLDREGGDAIIAQLAELQPVVARLDELLGTLLDDPKNLATWRSLRDEIDLIVESLDDFPEFKPILESLAELPPAVSATWRHNPWTAEEMEAAIATRTAEDLLRSDPLVAKSTARALERRAEHLAAAHHRWREANAAAILDRIRQRFLEHVRLSSLPHAQLTAEQKEWKPRYNRGRRELEHEFGKTMRYRSIRDLVSGDSGLVVGDLKPVWLMSPLSVSDTLPLGETPFDVVVFDEASQVTLEEAVPAIYRAGQVVIVGDEKQLPPTNFFAARTKDDEAAESEAETEFDEIDSDSLLNHAARTLPATMLRWHYRSRSESLISFSNALYYSGRLFTIPDVRPATKALFAIAAPNPEAGDRNVARLTDRAIGFHRLESGVYQGRRNAAEAEYLARLVRGLLMEESGLTIGVIAFSEAQQGEIEQALQRLADEDEAFRAKLEAEWEREEDGQFIGLLVKNLENIQGDERDVIILSVCYAPGPNGKMLMNFGPINQTGGERRLNVAFSRAKKHMALVSSIRGHQITNDYNDGARALKNYIRYAEAASAGDLETATRVLWEINPASDPAAVSGEQCAVAAELAVSLRERGMAVDANVGQSDFRCDLAIRSADGSYRLGILIDTDAYYRNPDAIEREILRPSLLRSFGWNVLRVQSRDWFESPEAVLRTVDAALRGEQLTDEVEMLGPPATQGTTEPSSSELPTTSPADRRYFECVEAGSKKFWEITVDGSQHTVRFGRIGSQGQSRTKAFPDGAAARRDADRLIREKLVKGYTEPRAG
jgi:superfamily I DNA and/or RNA helicase/predicted DNA-binding WGR domain protein